MDGGLPVHGEQETVDQFLDRWLRDSVARSVRPKTHASYADLVRLHISPAIGRVKLHRLEPRHVEELMRDRLEAGLSPRTVQYIRAVLRRALGQAMRWGLLSRNVAALVDGPRVPKRELRPLTPTEVREFLEQVRGDRLEALFVLALSTGLRQGELLGLRWSDVDLDGGTLRVSKALQRVAGTLQFVEPKSRSSHRVLALPAAAQAALRTHRVRQAEERLASGALWGGEDARWLDADLVFTTAMGTAIDARNLTRAFHRQLEEAGLPSIRFHDLRHSHASMLLAQGVHPRVMMETLGHSNISVTMDIYAHVMPEAKRDVADRVDLLLRGAG